MRLIRVDKETRSRNSFDRRCVAYKRSVHEKRVAVGVSGAVASVEADSDCATGCDVGEWEFCVCVASAVKVLIHRMYGVRVPRAVREESVQKSTFSGFLKFEKSENQ